MRISDVDILIIPGRDPLCDDHWQSRWLARLSSARLVAPGTSDPSSFAASFPQAAEKIMAALKACEKPVVLVAHSTGVAAVVAAAQHLPQDKIAGAFLVAACEPEHKDHLTLPNGLDTDRDLGLGGDEIQALAGVTLPFPSVLIASSSCPHCSLSRAKALASAWGSTLVEAGPSGHIDTASGHGPWPEGLMRFGSFLKSLG